MTKTEPLSTSTQKPKIELPNKKLVGVEPTKKKEIDESSKLPSPTGWRVLVLPFKQAEKTKGGLFIPDTAKEKPQRGEVVSVGPGKVENGIKVDMSVSKGDTVLYGKYSGTEINISDEDLLIMRESDILGIVND